MQFNFVTIIVYKFNYFFGFRFPNLNTMYELKKAVVPVILKYFLPIIKSINNCFFN